MGTEARTVTKTNAAEIAHWCGGRLVTEHDALDPSVTQPGINVRTMNDEIERAHVGDMLIKNLDGTFRIFRAE